MKDPTPNPSHTFDTPTKPTFNELVLLNENNPDGYCMLMQDRADSEDLKPLWSVPIGYFKNPDYYLPEFQRQFEEACNVGTYASNHTFFWRGHGYDPEAETQGITDHTGKPFHRALKGQRTERMLRWLNACWVDLDLYKANLTQGQVLAEVWDMMQANLIPPVSWIKNSGRGLWLFWALEQTRAFKKTELDSIPTFKRIQRQLQILFARMESDKRGKLTTQVSRIHGSINAGANKRVSMMVLYGHDGKVPRYHLDYLEAFFQTYPKRHNWKAIDSAERYQCFDDPSIEGQDKAPESRDDHRRNLGYLGESSRWKLDLERFWALAERVRSKRIAKGTRNDHAWILGAILRHVLIEAKPTIEQKAAAIEAAAHRLYACFEDPESYCFEVLTKQIKSAIDPAEFTEYQKRKARLEHQEIADELKITTLESQQLAELVYSTRKDRFWPPAKDQAPWKLKKKTKAEQATERRDFIRRNYTANTKPPCRALAREIESKLGLDCSPPTAQADWKAVFPPDQSHTQTKIEFPDD